MKIYLILTIIFCILIVNIRPIYSQVCTIVVYNDRFHPITYGDEMIKVKCISQCVPYCTGMDMSYKWCSQGTSSRSVGDMHTVICGCVCE
jgi:hypothetical protein